MIRVKPGCERNREVFYLSDSIITDDSIQAGIQEALGCVVTPFIDPQGKVWFRVTGDPEGALRKIYCNSPVPALTTLKNIKSLRHAIFSLKGKTSRGQR